MFSARTTVTLRDKADANEGATSLRGWKRLPEGFTSPEHPSLEVQRSPVLPERARPLRISLRLSSAPNTFIRRYLIRGAIISHSQPSPECRLGAPKVVSSSV